MDGWIRWVRQIRQIRKIRKNKIGKIDNKYIYKIAKKEKADNINKKDEDTKDREER